MRAGAARRRQDGEGSPRAPQKNKTFFSSLWGAGPPRHPAAVSALLPARGPRFGDGRSLLFFSFLLFSLVSYLEKGPTLGSTRLMRSWAAMVIDSVVKPQLKLTFAIEPILSSKNVSTFSRLPKGGMPPTCNP